MQATSDQDRSDDPPPAARLAPWAAWTTGRFASWLLGRTTIALVALVLLAAITAGLGHTRCVRPRAVLFVYQDSKGLAVEADERPGGSLVATATYFVFTDRNGFPASLRSEEHHSLGIIYEASAVPSGQDRATVAAFLASHANDPNNSGLASLAPFAGRIGAGNFTVTTWHIDGAVIDGAVGLLVLAAAVFVVVRVRRAYFAALRTARAAAGLCTGCGYVVHGLTGESCPECGGSLGTPAATTQGASA